MVAIAAITLVDYRWLAVNSTTAALTFLLAILLLATRWGLPEAAIASAVNARAVARQAAASSDFALA